MTENAYEPFVIPDAAEKRFPVAVAFSLVVNLSLIIGAGTLVRERLGAPTPDSGYIFLETVERDVAKATPAIAPIKAKSLPIIRAPSAPRRESGIVTDDLAPKFASPSPATPPAKTAASDARESAEKEVPRTQTIASVASAALPPVVATDARVPASNIASGNAVPLSGADGVASSTPAGELPAPESSPSSGPATSEPVGPTKTAETAYHELPRIPDALRESGYRSFVGVDVEVKEDGTFSATIRTSSGNPDVDARVMDALKRWKWKPALKNGVPITSVESFRFDFGVD